MEITSSKFEHNETIPPRYTCEGEDINPPLTFNDIPEDTESLVLIVDDPDAPSGTWVHWLVWNIEPETPDIEEDSVPDEAIEGVTSFGSPGYGGPCPPSGVHRYHFKLYALDTMLDLDENTEKDELLEVMDSHVIEEADLIGKYSKRSN